jgi:iron complex transport system substrate-binding protein
MKKWLLPLVVLLAGAVLIACDDDDNGGNGGDPTPQDTESAGKFPVEITDDAGQTVTIDAQPEAIVTLSPSFAEVLFEIGAGGAVVAVDENADYPAEVADLPKISGFEPSVEAIAAYEPDLVMMAFDPSGLQKALTDLGIDVLFLANPADLDGVYAQIETIGEASGHLEDAESVTEEMRNEIDEIVSQVPDQEQGPRAFHELDNTYFTVGPGSFQGSIYDLLEAQNIANATGEPFPQMTNEAIIAADPEVIALADGEFGESLETVAARPGWESISAVVNGRVIPIDDDLLSRPGPRVVDGVSELAGILYPETFGQ